MFSLPVPVIHWLCRWESFSTGWTEVSSKVILGSYLKMKPGMPTTRRLLSVELQDFLGYFADSRPRNGPIENNLGPQHLLRGQERFTAARTLAAFWSCPVSTCLTWLTPGSRTRSERRVCDPLLNLSHDGEGSCSILVNLCFHTLRMGLAAQDYTFGPHFSRYPINVGSGLSDVLREQLLDFAAGQSLPFPHHRRVASLSASRMLES